MHIKGFDEIKMSCVEFIITRGDGGRDKLGDWD